MPPVPLSSPSLPLPLPTPPPTDLGRPDDRECGRPAANPVQITRDRDGEPAQLSTVQGVLESMVKMCSYETQPAAVYVSEFEEPFLAATEAYYARESSQYLSEYDSSSYMVKAEARLEEELMRSVRARQLQLWPRMARPAGGCFDGYQFTPCTRLRPPRTEAKRPSKRCHGKS